MTQDIVEEEGIPLSTTNYQTLTRRWYILGIFGLLGMLQVSF